MAQYLVVHVYPEDDERLHDEAGECWCGPIFEPHDNGEMWIHFAADMREEYEAMTGDGLPAKKWIRHEITYPVEPEPWQN